MYNTCFCLVGFTTLHVQTQRLLSTRGVNHKEKNITIKCSEYFFYFEGSKEMRGLAAQEAELKECMEETKDSGTDSTNPYKVYELPFQHILNKYNIFSKIPMCPQYQELKLPSVMKFRKRKAAKSEK